MACTALLCIISNMLFSQNIQQEMSRHGHVPSFKERSAIRPRRLQNYTTRDCVTSSQKSRIKSMKTWRATEVSKNDGICQTRVCVLQIFSWRVFVIVTILILTQIYGSHSKKYQGFRCLWNSSRVLILMATPVDISADDTGFTASYNAVPGMLKSTTALMLMAQGWTCSVRIFREYISTSNITRWNSAGFRRQLCLCQPRTFDLMSRLCLRPRYIRDQFGETGSNIYEDIVFTQFFESLPLVTLTLKLISTSIRTHMHLL